MTNPSPAACALPLPLDLPTLAAGLQTALEALKPFLAAEAVQLAENTSAIANQAPGMEETGQTRTYHISQANLSDERAYLQQFNTGTSLDLLLRTLDRLSVTVTLMEQVDATQDLSEYFLQSLGGNIRESLNILERIVDFLSQMELIYTRTVE